MVAVADGGNDLARLHADRRRITTGEVALAEQQVDDRVDGREPLDQIG